jgi:hypothetical protein
MIRKLLLSVMALALVAGSALVSAQPADARGGRFAAGVAAGLIGLGVLGAYAHARDRDYYPYRPRRVYGDGCYRGPERCYRAAERCFYNRYGDYVCRGGGLRCHRPLYCD